MGQEAPELHGLRFRGVQRLFGALALQGLEAAHVAVLGVGTELTASASCFNKMF